MAWSKIRLQSDCFLSNRVSSNYCKRMCLFNCSQTEFIAIILVLWSFNDSNRSIGIQQVSYNPKYLVCIGVLTLKICAHFSAFSRQWEVKLEWLFWSRWSGKGSKKLSSSGAWLFSMPLQRSNKNGVWTSFQFRGNFPRASIWLFAVFNWSRMRSNYWKRVSFLCKFFA